MYRLFFTFFVTIISLIACSTKLAKTEAERLAKIKIEEYAKANKISLSEFSKYAVSSEGANLWVFDYGPTHNVPKRSVRIYVDARGHTELHALIE